MRTKEEVIAEVERLTQVHNTIKSVDETYFSTLIKEARKYDLWTEVVNINCDLANIYFNTLGNFDLAKYVLNTCKRAFRKSVSDESIARYYLVYANLYRLEFKLPNAIGYLNKSLAVILNSKSNSKGMLKLEFNCNYILAIIFNQLGELPKFKYYILKAEKIAVKLNDTLLFANCLSHKGTYYTRLRRFDLAENFLEQAIDLLRVTNNVYALGNAMNKLGEIYYSQEKYHISLNYFLDSYELLSNQFPNTKYCSELVKIGENYLKINNPNEAEKYFFLASEQSKYILNKDAKVTVLKGLCNYYSLKEDYKKVLYFRDQMDEIKEEIQSTERAKKVLEVEEKYHSALKQKEINYRKKKQRDSNKYLKLMEQKNEDLQQFSYALAHDLREPIRSTKNFINVVAKKTNNPELDIYLNVVNGNLDRMYQLVDDILSLTKLDFEEVEKQSLNMQELVAVIKDNLALQIEERSAQIISGQLPEVNANKNHIIQLFQNLISNGIKYNRNKPVIEIGFDPDIKVKGAFYIKDNGIGIPKDKLEHVFGLFKRAHGKEFQGTGVGLAICKKIVDKLKGEIWVESEEGRGTCFYIRLF